MKTDKRTTEWKTLERQVATHYEALGYHVTHDKSVLGHQIDILATKYIDGGTAITVMVEVKHRKGKPVGVNEVTRFLNTAKHLLSEFKISNAVLIADSGFSQTAYIPVSDSPNIQLLTLGGLEQDIFGYSESLLKIRLDYEGEDQSKTYVPLAGTPATGIETADIAKYCLRWAEGEDPLLLVLGDFGAGKTTVLMRIRYDQSLARIRNQNARYPVLLRLRRLRHHSDLWGFISESLRADQYISPNKSAFFSQLSAGRLLVLLDGFDEIDTGASAEDRGRYLAQLSPLIASRSPCIVTTRPTYFESFEDLRASFEGQDHSRVRLRRVDERRIDLDAMLKKLSLPTRGSFSSSHLSNALIISQWDEPRILRFLENHKDELWLRTSRTSEEIKVFLDRIYDLEDLMKRPLLMDMIVQTILAGKVDITDDAAVLGPSSLYEIYTQLCAERDRPRSEYLTVDERLEASRCLALAMLKKGEIELNLDEVHGALRGTRLGRRGATRGNLSGDELGRILADIRVNAFLSMAEDGSFRFAHKSFYEFFVAQHIRINAVGSSPSLAEFSVSGLSREIMYFLGSYGRDDASFSQVLMSTVRARSRGQAVHDFACRIVMASGALLGRIECIKATVRGVDVRRATVSGGVIIESTLDGLSFRKIEARGWRVAQAAFVASEIHDCRFERCEMTMRLEGTTISSVRFDRGSFSADGPDWTLENCYFDGTDVDFAGTGRLVGCRVQGGQVTLGKGLRLGEGTLLRVTSASLLGHATDEWLRPGAHVRYEDCEILGVRISAADLVALVDDEGKLLRGLKGCSGIVFMPQPDGGTARQRKEYYWGPTEEFGRLNPGLLVADEARLNRELEDERRSHMSDQTSGPTLLEAFRRKVRSVRRWHDPVRLTPLARYL